MSTILLYVDLLWTNNSGGRQHSFPRPPVVVLAGVVVAWDVRPKISNLPILCFRRIENVGSIYLNDFVETADYCSAGLNLDGLDPFRE
jgi:hypothetical protein